MGELNRPNNMGKLPPMRAEIMVVKTATSEKSEGLTFQIMSCQNNAYLGRQFTLWYGLRHENLDVQQMGWSSLDTLIRACQLDPNGVHSTEQLLNLPFFADIGYNAKDFLLLKDLKPKVYVPQSTAPTQQQQSSAPTQQASPQPNGATAWM